MLRLSMAALCAIVLALAFIGAMGAPSLAADEDAAAQHYVAGDKAWIRGNVDEAITEWSEALKLKPTSGLTKDRLIEALIKKIGLLNQQIAEMRSTSGNGSITIKSTGSNTAVDVITPKLLPPEKYTADAISDGLSSSKVTTAQADAFWNSIVGWQVRWDGVINNVKQKSIAIYEVELGCGKKRIRVKATAKMSDATAVSLVKGKAVVVTGILESRENQGSSCSFGLTSAEIR